MEANELRIGNKVLNPYHEKVYTVEGFKYSREPGGERRAYVSTYEYSGNTVKISVLQPIPLTEVWLQRAGAKQGGGDKWVLGKLNIERRSDGFYLSTVADPIKVAYVHDLQNIYYYFHGKVELEFVSFH